MSAQDTDFSQKTSVLFNQNSGNLVMGILNITPDSFYDGGRYQTQTEWMLKAEEMIREGAAIIDVGAYSTRPGAENISVETELERLLPAIRTIRARFPKILISADTFRAAVAREAVKAGADIINDIGGGTLDPEMFSTVVELNVPYILMHIQGTPQTMQLNPQYTDVSAEVTDFLQIRAKELERKGHKKIILDPGFGFGKTVEQNFELLQQLERICNLGYPVLAGFSRKSFIYKSLNINKEDSLAGTTALNMIALQKGARILRVHDVKPAVECVQLWSKLS